ncbi:MAG: thiamine ABC transporter substrate-binding protein [Candidatus Cloacimonas sp.]|jgi:ABC transporter substrate-binding protein (ThiB subfamily)|nr:thiamine ABC transporter substrate-binding protein [Candidatus Cloacimonas sp.]
MDKGYLFRRIGILRYILLCSTILLIAACGKAENQTTSKQAHKNKLTIFCTDAFRTSGLESTIIPEFSKKHDCSIELVLFRNAAELCSAVKDKTKYCTYDLAIGIDNSFALSESLTLQFVPPDDFNPEQLTKETIFDPQLRLIPYAYSSMCLVYNTKNIPVAPQSFGELQDAKYLSQIAICDPHDSGVGRATLFWSLALFGPDGYEHLWKSLRKNIYKSYPDRNEALAALTKGECNLLMSLNTIPAYLQELDPQNTNFAGSMLKEGSYQYIESVGVHRGSNHAALASKFVQHMLSPEAQKMVVYKLGMFPANRKTLLPMHFSSIPFTSYAVNSRISQSLIAEQLNLWLDFWDRLFGFQIS